jgi:hypothetical protein
MKNPFFEDFTEKLTYEEAVHLVKSSLKQDDLVEFCEKNPHINYNSLKNALVDHKKKKIPKYPGIIEKTLDALGYRCDLTKELFYIMTAE